MNQPQMCPHVYKRPALGVGEKVWTECLTCGWREDTGSIVVSASRICDLETELAISKGREEGKQLVIDQLESERDHLQRGFNAAVAIVAAHEDRIKELEAERDELALDTTKSDAEAYEKRICELEATLKEAELQRDSWKRIAESGIGIPQAETASEAGMKDAPAWIDDGAGGLVNLGMALFKTKGDEA